MARAYLTKADLLAGITLKPQDFEVEGLGWVQVRGLGLADLSELRAKHGNDDTQIVLHGAHRGLVNPQLSVEDLDALGQGDAGLVSSIGKRVFELSATGDKDEIDPLAGDGSSS